MSMSKKHFNALADAVGTEIGRATCSGSMDEMANSIVEALCFVCRDANPAFDTARFKKAIEDAADHEWWILSLPEDAQRVERAKQRDRYAGLTH